MTTSHARYVDRRDGLPSLVMVRLPAQPLIDVGTKRGHDIKELKPGLVRQYWRAKERGWVTEASADSLAIALGYHPSEIWDEWI